MGDSMSTAGWYPDPFERAEVRYYDGRAWSEHVATGGVQHVDPALPTPSAVSLASAAAPPALTGASPTANTAAHKLTASADERCGAARRVCVHSS